MAAIIIPGQSGTYRHQQGRVNALLAESGLNEPLLAGTQGDGSVVFPSLAEGYLAPRCRIGEVGPGDDPAAAEWLDQQLVVPDIEVFLTGYLTSLRAVRSPLMVLVSRARASRS